VDESYGVEKGDEVTIRTETRNPDSALGVGELRDSEAVIHATS
jgi:hypothetical protein